MEKEELIITDLMKDSLSKMAYWGKLFGVLGFICIALMVIAAFAIISIGTDIEGFNGYNSGMLGFIYIIGAVFYFFPSKYIYVFSKQCRLALNTNSQVKISDAFGNLASVFTFWGVTSAIMIGVYAVLIIFGGLSAL